MTPIVVREGNTIEIPLELGKRFGITPGRQVYVSQLGDTLFTSMYSWSGCIRTGEEQREKI